MAEARARDEWARTSALMALLANCHRDPKRTRAFRSSDFDPFAQPGKPVKTDISVLKDVFIDRKVPTEAKR